MSTANFKLITLKTDGTCIACSATIPAGAKAWWAPKRVQCTGCHDVQHVLPDEPAAPSADVAGASARATSDRAATRDTARYEKAVAEDAAWREATRQKHRYFGRIATALTPKPEFKESRKARNYRIGADGEEIVAEWLAKAAGVEVLHDRHWPGTSLSNIDHIAVGPKGVFIVDAKKWTGKIDVVNKGNLFKEDWRLVVGGRDRRETVDGVLAQVEALRGVLGQEFEAVPVSGILCFTEGTWAFPKVAMNIRGVTVLWPNKLPELVSAAGAHASIVEQLAEHLRTALRPAR
ncbi:MAG: NERD domain-containing protein [Rhodococcus sp.]|nr:NERD domain-containing protein [Rhodococcus sp. (in: high G+C Gram-positive bacteria)]